MWSLESQLQENPPTFEKLSEWNNRDKLSKYASARLQVAFVVLVAVVIVTYRWGYRAYTRLTMYSEVVWSHVKESWTGFHALDSSLCHWNSSTSGNVDSEVQSLVGFQIPFAVFRIPKPRTPDSTLSKTSQKSGFPYMSQSDFFKLVSWDHNVVNKVPLYI